MIWGYHHFRKHLWIPPKRLLKTSWSTLWGGIYIDIWEKYLKNLKEVQVFIHPRSPRFHFRVQVPVLLQNRNGPCALLAIANGLLYLCRQVLLVFVANLGYQFFLVTFVARPKKGLLDCFWDHLDLDMFKMVVSNMFHFHTYFGKKNPLWPAYFSNGLVQPPTSFVGSCEMTAFFLGETSDPQLVRHWQPKWGCAVRGTLESARPASPATGNV